MDRRIVMQQAERYDSFYLYEEAAIVQAAERLKSAFGDVTFLYSLKTNSFAPVRACVFAQGLGADAASLAEVEMAHEAGLGPDMIQYSAPGKSRSDIEAALPIATVIADSVGEIHLISQLAQAKGMTARIGVRINPDFTLEREGGVPSKFGIDEGEVLKELPMWDSLPGIEIVGIHVHARSQELSADVLAGYYERMFCLAQRVQQALGRSLAFINMGSGLGIDYSLCESPLDTTRLGQRMAQLMHQFGQQLPGTKVFLETGRYMVGKGGTYHTKVMDKKVSHGKTFVILCNTLNGFVRPSLARMVAKYSPDEQPAGSEPLFTRVDAFEFIAQTDATEQERVTLVGNLCTATDVIAEDILLPQLQVGDMVSITNAGSYAAVLTPMQFASQVPPAQLFVCQDGKIMER